MRLKLIACKVLTRELSYLCALSDNVIDITWMRQGYHDRPEQLPPILQQEIDEIEAGTNPYTNPVVETGEGGGVPDDYEAILLGYGLCSNAITGVYSRKYRMIIPKAHDCITLFLGSKERYAKVFNDMPGCFWYTAGWIDHCDMHGEGRTNRLRKHYADMDYDEETVDYLIEELGGLKNYRANAYISMPFLDNSRYRAVTRKAADYLDWEYTELDGDMSLMEKLIAGDWNENDFLILEPGEMAAPSYDANVLKKVPVPGFSG